MMKTENYIKWLIFAFLSLFLVACKPTADFIYTPSAPSTGEVVKFDASKSSVYKAKEGNAISVYAWDFGDGSQGTGQTTEHTYTIAGKYVVKLSVTDLAGQTSATTQKITVKQGVAVTQKVSALIQSSDGTLLPNAKVTIQGQTATTDQNGQANLNLTLAQNTTKVVVTFEKDGFITQSILVDIKDLNSVQASLRAVKDTLLISHIEDAQTISAMSLGATITFAENSFVIESTGVTAKGQVIVKVTPWDITGTDLNAMPANGFARDAKGNIVQLISAGMITAEFFDAQGNKLQLATGKTADIKMDLPFTSLQNKPLGIDSVIPMWHFSEIDGLWIEEGTGKVVAEKDSKTGLAVQATVKHFSTWNWDQPVYLNEGGSAFVKCISGDIPIRCDIRFTIQYKDNSRLAFKLNGGISESGLMFSDNIGLPKNDQISKVDWTATNGLLQGVASSGTNGDQVTIQLGAPKSKNFIRCRLPDHTFSDCSVINDEQEYKSISKEGGTVISGSNGTSKKWTASSYVVQGSQVVIYQGTATSGAFDDVIIDLTTKSIPYLIQCKLADGSSVGCDVKADNNITLYARASGQVYYLDGEVNLNWNANSLPSQENGVWVQYSGNTFKVNGNKIEIQLSQKTIIGNSVKNLQLKCSVGIEACSVRVFIIPAALLDEWFKGNYDPNLPLSFDRKINMDENETVAIVLPNVNPQDFIVFDSMSGDYSSTRTPGIPNELLSENQVIEIPWDYSLYQMPE